MIIIGQHHIANQLKFLLPDLFKNKSKGANFLLRGPSGYGKTTIAIEMATYLAGNSFQVYYADKVKWNFRKRVIFIDEVHQVKEFESLYREMDKAINYDSKSDDAHVLIFATNADSNLPEAFTNRCFQLILSDYSDDELLLIARKNIEFFIYDDALLEVIDAANRNPRELVLLCRKLSVYFSENPNIIPMTVDFRDLLKEIFNIEGGIDTLSRRYLEILEEIGGTGSIGLIKSILHVDENTLKNQVEPVLLRKKLIRITSKGRSIIA